ncbi:MAG: polysaccharide pyruvyl transferase family protein [Chloroflexota bacterium]|nr:polysaccharide pyruvyl transferase family protein [Chloroflexota bacterium]
MKVLLINNHSVLNVGDHAILVETLRLLQAGVPQVEIVLTFNDTVSAQAMLPGYPIRSSPLTWMTRTAEDGETTVAVARWRQAGLIVLLVLQALIYRLTHLTPRLFVDDRKHDLVRAFAAAELVLACGGGYIYASGPHDGVLGGFNLRLINCLLAVLMGKPLVLLPQSIGPLYDIPQRRIVQWIVRRARLTFVRERQSLAILQALGCAERALYAPDLAFGMTSAPDERTAQLREHVRAVSLQPAFLVGMTAINWHGQNIAFDRQQRYEQALISFIDTITAKGGVVVFFNQCCGPTAVEDDRLVHARLRERVAQARRVILIDDVLPPDVIQAAYGEMDYFVGTRLHSVILALNAGVPSIAIGYLQKTAGVLGAVGLTDWCCDINELTAEQLGAMFSRLQQQAVQPEASAYVQRAGRTKQALPALLRMVVGKG